MAFPQAKTSPIVHQALLEDRAWEDGTTLALVAETKLARGRIVAKEDGYLAGCAFAEQAFRSLDPEVVLHWRCQDGARLNSGQVILDCQGKARALLSAERTALNFLQQLSGVATMTAQAVEAAGSVAVLDTRKTVPGLRDAQKLGVRAGGGVNHRRDLADQWLLKENHFALSGRSFGETVELALEKADGVAVGVEVVDFEQARTAIVAGADFVLLDNFKDAELAEVVSRLRELYPDAVLEVSGGYGLHNLAGLRQVGLDRVSVGALTHSAPALDLSFLLETVEAGEDQTAHSGMNQAP